jgi:formate dehydrogenase subunit gamma
MDHGLSRRHRGLSTLHHERVGATNTTEGRAMTYLLARARFVFAAIAIGCLLVFVSPALAQQAGATVDPQADAVNQQMLLKQFPRIQGDINQLDPRARVLIQPAGRGWEYFHQVILRWIGAIAIIGTVVTLAVAYYALGRMRIAAGRSGRKLLRFKAFERAAHWLTAISFVVLAITGLNITFGKALLLPLIGPDAFSVWSQYAKYTHNYVSFAFVLGLVLIVVVFIRDNMPDKSDIVWFKQGGGFIKSKHAPAGRFNAGEKLVFWGALGAGVAVVASGFLLLFPFYITNIFGMQIAQVVHAIIAMLFIALILGHIYIGTLGMEGAFEAMWTGEVDYNWAKEHHDLWVADMLAKGRTADRLDHSSAVTAE